MGNSIKDKLHHKTLVDGVFQATVVVLWGGEYKKAYDYVLKKYGVQLELEQSDLFSFGFVSERLNENDLNGWIFWVGDVKTVGSVVHEVVHLVHNILTYKGLDYKNDELRAFYEEYWFDRITQLIKKR